MTLDLSFKQLCSFVKKDAPHLIDAVDKLLGLALICSPLAIGATVAAALPTLAVKNEVVRLGKSLFESLSNKTDQDYVSRQERMQMAHGLLCYTAFFDALDRQIPEKLREEIGLLEPEKIFLAKTALEKTACAPNMAPGDDPEEEANPLAALTVPFPHPMESLAQQIEHHTVLWTNMAQGFRDFVQKLALWEEADEKQQAQIVTAVNEVPKVAGKFFEAQYFELARRYQDFAVWANLQEHKKARGLIGEVSEYVRRLSLLSNAATTSIDIGFTKLHEAVRAIPETLKVSQATDIVESLANHYRARVNDPILEEKDEAHEDHPQLSFPKVSEAFIPQSYRVLRYSGKTRRLEDEATWKDFPRREDLGAFLLSYLSSPYSTETPLVILGHPGSGKSLLTTVLSAQLMSKHYTTIRVPLREVNAEASIVAQIEERIRGVTSIGVDSWAKLSGAFKNSPLIVILDGYDELLQASGKVFSGYLKDVQTFQKNEAELGRPVRVIVTSRVTLIDKAMIPHGTTVLRLLEFDKRQRGRWLSIWNTTNADYFKHAHIEKLALPEEKDPGADKILSLAEQPLLLLMLALYDSEKNQLRRSESLDRTILYDSLLRRFVERERRKDKEFDYLDPTERQQALDREMQRLGVAALGMYNRRKLHILSPELAADLEFFDLERPSNVTSGRALSQADLLLGSFFFVHKSSAQLTSGALDNHEESSAFEFLHNTLGEFLTADFVLRCAVAEVQQLDALKKQDVLRPRFERHLDAADGLSRQWFACLVYTPLFTRPVVVEMLREWIHHALHRTELSRGTFVSYLDNIILNQIKRLLSKREMPSIMHQKTIEERYHSPFGDHPLLGHIAIYSINLILLRAIVTDDPFVFDENQIGIHEDGARPWDRLTHLWRSWFGLDNLNGITAFLLADRKDSKIEIRSKHQFQVAESQNRLQTYLNVAVSIGDNISSGLAGLLLFEPARQNRLSIDQVASRLASEKIDLEFEVTMKRLFESELLVAEGRDEEFVQAARGGLEIAVFENRFAELEHVALSVRRAVQRTMRGVVPPQLFPRRAVELFRSVAHPRLACDAVMHNPSAALILYRVAADIGDKEWAVEFRRRFADFPWDPYQMMGLIDRHPEAALAWLQLAREVGRKRLLLRHGEHVLARAFHPRFLMELLERNPDAALAWLQVAQEMAGTRRLQHIEPEFFERALHPGYLLELSKRNPEAALAWLKVAREMGGDRFLARRVGEVLQSFEPQYLLELSERNPEAALDWLRLARAVGGEPFLEPYRQEFLKEAFHPRFLMELAEHNPEAALAWLQVAREVGGHSLLEGDGGEFFKGIFHPRYLVDLIQRNPEAALAWVQVVRDLGGARFLAQHAEEFFNRAFRPGYLLEVSERSPEAALAWLQVILSLGGGGFLERQGEEFMKRTFHPRYVRQLSARNPEAALTWLQVSYELGGDQVLQRYDPVVFEEALSPSVLSHIVRHRPVTFGLPLRIARTTRALQAKKAIVECIASFLRGAGSSVLETLPLAALPDIEWLADETRDPDLNFALNQLVGSNGRTRQQPE